MNDDQLVQVPARPPLLVRAALYTLLPILLTLALPLLLLFILAIYLLALVHGTRVFLFSRSSEEDEPTYAKPHFLDIEIPAKVISDEQTKG